jgi:hypothetical protein
MLAGELEYDWAGPPSTEHVMAPRPLFPIVVTVAVTYAVPALEDACDGPVKEIAG